MVAKQILALLTAVAMTSAHGIERFTPMHCPRDWTLNGHVCFKQKFAEPQAVCPSGTEINGLDCVLAADQIQACPDGSYYSSHMDACAQEVRANKIPMCASGLDLVQRDGVPACQRIVETESKPYCDSGFEMESNLCHRSLDVMPIFTCNTRERLSGDFCHREEEVDCRSMGSIHRVLLGKTNGVRKCKRSVKRRAIQACPLGRVLGGRCVEETAEPPMYQCPGVCSVETTCRHVETLPVDWTCPAGYKQRCLEGRFGGDCHCSSEVAVDATMTCPSGHEFVAGHCFLSFPAAVQCAENYNLDGHTCVQTCFSEARVVYVPVVETCSTC